LAKSKSYEYPHYAVFSNRTEQKEDGNGRLREMNQKRDEGKWKAY
jgi:hypothetical protein